MPATDAFALRAAWVAGLLANVLTSRRPSHTIANYMLLHTIIAMTALAGLAAAQKPRYPAPVR